MAVCLKDKCYDVFLPIASDMQSLTAIWMSDFTILKAMRDNLVDVCGVAHLRKNISCWLGCSYYADVKSAR